MIMKNINITKAKSHLSAILKEVVDNDEEIIISKGGDPIAKIIKYSCYAELVGLLMVIIGAIFSLGMFRQSRAPASPDKRPRLIFATLP